jgi:cytochrome P450
MSEVAVPLPIRVIAAILGIPLDREGDYKRWSDAFVAIVGRKISKEEWLEKARNQVDMQAFFARELDMRRLEPTDDLLTDLLGATREEPPGLSYLELLDVPQHFLVAGNETTTLLMGEMIRYLDGHPRLFSQMREQPELIVNVVEEALRLASPVLGLYRVCVNDTEVGGVVIPAGSIVSLLWGGANHDPKVFEDPESFDPKRENAGKHLSFGKGMHFCLGAPLARLEAKVLLSNMVERYSAVHVIDDSVVEDTRSFMLRSLKSLRVSFVE